MMYTQTTMYMSIIELTIHIFRVFECDKQNSFALQITLLLLIVVLCIIYQFFFLVHLFVMASNETLCQHVWCEKKIRVRDTDLRFLSTMTGFLFLLFWLYWVFWNAKKNQILCSCSSSSCYWIQVQWHKVYLDVTSSSIFLLSNSSLFLFPLNFSLDFTNSCGAHNN